jgi:hypothetical protein
MHHQNLKGIYFDTWINEIVTCGNYFIIKYSR